METGFIGGVISRSRKPLDPNGITELEKADWSWVGESQELFLYAAGQSCQLFQWGPLALLIKGNVQLPWSSEPSSTAGIAERLRLDYVDQGALNVADLEGSFTLILLDGRAEKALIYRNLVGNTLTYYVQTEDGLYFSSNLATLLDAEVMKPQLDESMLPTLFVHRCAPGRETMVKDCFKVMPGEQLELRERKVTRSQRRTLGDFPQARESNGNAIDRLEELMSRIFREHAAQRPQTANLLSGGVDSSYLQSHWGAVWAGNGSPPSFSVAVDHPRSRPDTEYALSASKELGTRHNLVQADEPFEWYLLDTIAGTAELPDHAQTVYFRQLARAMVSQGFSTGLCGEAADSLFGLSLTTDIQMATLFRALCPGTLLKRMGGLAARALRKPWLAYAFELAGFLDEEDRLDHPLSTVSIHTDWDQVEACFGRDAIEEVVRNRRKLLNGYHVPNRPLDRLNAAGYIGSASGTASLWTGIYNSVGGDLFCPFLDSRVIALVMSLPAKVRFPFRSPKGLLKKALASRTSEQLAYRKKLGFGQPVFEWLSDRGQLAPRVDSIASYPFLSDRRITEARKKPSWFLYTLLCFDIWHKMFIQRSLPRPQNQWWRERGSASEAS